MPVFSFLVCKTAVYTQVNGVITHQKQQISKRDITQHDIALVSCSAEQYHLFKTIAG